MNTRQSDPCVRPRAAAIGILLLAAALPLPAGGSAESAAGQRAEASEQGSATITISGHGEVSAQPDRATVTVGVQLFDKDARAASSALRERMNAVIDAIRSLGIADRHIRTTNYSISFERDYQAGRAETIDETIDQSGPPGVYRVENMVRVLITDVTQAAAVVETAVEAGANQMYGIEFSFSDPASLEEEARSRAVDNARKRAEDLATATGRSLGRVLEIREEGSGSARGDARIFAEGLGAGPVQPGESRYTAVVRITYELE